MRKFLTAAFLAAILTISFGCDDSTSTTDAPTDLVGATWLSSYIILDWEDVDGATSYNVYRSTSSGDVSSKSIVASALTVSAYMDDTLASGSTYYYQVTAVNSDGESEASDEISVTME